MTIEEKITKSWISCLFFTFTSLWDHFYLLLDLCTRKKPKAKIEDMIPAFFLDVNLNKKINSITSEIKWASATPSNLTLFLRGAVFIFYFTSKEYFTGNAIGNKGVIVIEDKKHRKKENSWHNMCIF